MICFTKLTMIKFQDIYREQALGMLKVWQPGPVCHLLGLACFFYRAAKEKCAN